MLLKLYFGLEIKKLFSSLFLCREIQKKCKSKEAARSRRGQQNDEFQELSRQLPLPDAISNQLDRLCIMRLTNSYIKIKKLLESMMNSGMFII